jgi:hypothetical protein
MIVPNSSNGFLVFQHLMKTKLLLSTIVAITIVASIGFGLGPGQKMSSAFAAPSASVPMCGPNTVPIPGGSQVASYYVSATYSGQCSVGDELSKKGEFCNVVNGIGQSGHCEPVKIGYVITQDGPATLPTEEWFSFAGKTLQPGEFLDMVDTTPFFTEKGHVAMVIPCNQNGDPQVKLFEGILDGGLNTLESISPQYLQHISSPQSGLCVYHFDIGKTANNPDGVTDFAVVNISNNPITFGDRNTSTFSLAEGYLNENS